MIWYNILYCVVKRSMAQEIEVVCRFSETENKVLTERMIEALTETNY